MNQLPPAGATVARRANQTLVFTVQTDNRFAHRPFLARHGAALEVLDLTLADWVLISVP